MSRWNVYWRCFNLISGHKLATETFHQCMVRELAEELGLESFMDYLVRNVPLAHLEYTDLSKSAQVETAYTIEAFDVEFTSEAIWDRVMANPRVRALTEREIREGQCTDGSPVSAAILRVLDSVGWECPPHRQRSVRGTA